MRLPINQVAHGIGMQNQYLGGAVHDKKVKGEVKYNGDYHSDESWVDIQSVKEYVEWRYKNWVIGEEQYQKSMQFLDNLLQNNTLK